MATTRTLCILYVLGGALAAHAASVSAVQGAVGYAGGFGAVALLMVVASLREYLAGDERRVAALRAEARARPRVPDYDAIDGAARVALAAACCEMWWTSAGTEHSGGCGRRQQRRAA
ncbi:hypothetical protein [Streptomyces indicus]|uniref:Uncharacterized protein n=1 Tax=Streptomyces indicus TaxID=417292 RepID=A0A1G9HMI1_9ACTN|nr:hypothetical protein [Streptomyces indicus]SDL14075.1 hypothetical protein SAMN05421806_11988 [Streptomyces indicus]